MNDSKKRASQLDIDSPLKKVCLTALCAILTVGIVVLFTSTAIKPSRSRLHQSNIKYLLDAAVAYSEKESLQQDIKPHINELFSLDAYGTRILHSKQSIVDHNRSITTRCILLSAGEDKTMGTSDDVEVSVILKRKRCIVDNKD